MTGEQFSDKDNAFINDCVRDVNVPYGEKVYLKRCTGIASPGDPIGGTQPVYAYSITPVQVIINVVTPSDVSYSGGIFLLGDLRITMTQQLNFEDTAPQVGGTSEGDRIIWKNHEYRIVGRWDCEPLVQQDRLYSYVFRKVGNS